LLQKEKSTSHRSGLIFFLVIEKKTGLHNNDKKREERKIIKKINTFVFQFLKEATTKT